MKGNPGATLGLILTLLLNLHYLKFINLFTGTGDLLK